MNASKKRFNTIDEYIAAFPQHVQQILERLRQAIKESAPNATETISYQIVTFKLHGNLVHFPAVKNHIGFYPTPSAISEFATELSRYEVARGSVKFPLNKPIPFDLIRQIVKYRVRENTKKR